MRLGRLVGAALQAIVLGTLLFAAAVEILGVESLTRVFRYQGF
jgi:hypothetical protein